MKRKIRVALVNLVYLVIPLMLVACGGGGGGGGGDDTPPTVWEGTWALNIQETDWGEEFNSELPLYIGSFLEIDGDKIRVVFIRGGYLETDITGTYSVDGTTFTAKFPGVTVDGTYDFQNDNTKVVIYWSEDSGGDIEVYDKQPVPPVYAIGSSFLQYRVYEIGTTSYQAWLPITKNGAPVQETDIVDIRLFDSLNNTVNPASSQLLVESYMFLNCAVTPCVQSGPIIERAYYGNYAFLPEDTYSFKVDTADGQTLLRDIPFPGQLVLPIVRNGVSAWNGNDLVLNWTNPDWDLNWAEVDQLRIRLFTGAGTVILNVRLNPTAQSVTIPEALLAQAAILGGGSAMYWEIQTRAYDANNMNFARGYSFRSLIVSP